MDFWSKMSNKTFLIPKFRHYYFFRKILQINKLEVADLKYDNNFLKILARKCPNKAFLVPSLGILILLRLLQIDKFEGADFK